MAFTRFCKKADLERAVGGAAVLIELLDKNKDGIADETLVVDCIDAGSNELASYIQSTVALESLTEPYPLVLIFKSADAAAFYAWVKGSDRQAVPDAVREGYDAAVRWAQDVGLRKATLAVTPKPTLDPPSGFVDPDPLGMGISITAFRKGFR